MACRWVARRVDQVVGVIGPLHIDKSTPFLRLRTSSWGPLHRHNLKRWMGTKQRSRQDVAGQHLTSYVVTTRPSTLDPTKFTQNDVLDLSGTASCMMNACSEKAHLFYKSFGNTAKSEQFYVPFPSGTKGVFYFHDRTNVHPVAGDVRFRVLPLDRVQDWRSVDCSKLFAEGEDLLDHNGLGPWRISLLSIIYKQRPVLFELLKQCRYISKAAEMQVGQLRLSVAARRTYVVGLGSQVIDRIADPFTLNLGSHSQAVVFLQQEGITPHKIFPQQMTNAQDIQRRKKHMAYSGTALVRYEIIRYEGRNRIVLRVLKFLKPPNPNDVVFQEEGELLKKYDPRNQTEKTWMANGMAKANPEFITPSSMKLLEELYLSSVTG